MKTITIKVFSACQAVEFFNVVNPFMFHGEVLSRFRRYPEWYFMDAETGESIETQVRIPDDCDLVQDLVSNEVRLDFPGASLVIEYAIVDSYRFPCNDDCNCTLDTNTETMI